ncbi:hypothetical protein X753_24180 [Mesorhizobium sp. LNJC399B00]|nr:hypothetical protein X753_24180 [Mesorhizobium sp. LNJC399B00]
MRWWHFGAMAIGALTLGVGAAEMQTLMSSGAADKPARNDQVYAVYFKSLFAEPGKAQSEFQILAKESPLLTSYGMALFAGERCGIPQPSANLIRAAGGDAAFKTEAGKKVFAVAGVVATMEFPTAENEGVFCDAARKLIEASEKVAAAQK